MKALVVAPQPFFSPRGTPFSVYYRTLVTAKLGVEVDLLTYGEGQDVDIPGVRIIRIPRFKWLGPVSIGPSLLKAFLDLYIALWTFGLLIVNRYAFVHAHEESVFICRFLKPLFGFKLIYDMHSSLPQQMRNFQFTKSRMVIGVFNWLERSCLKTADAVITICPELAAYAISIMPDPRRHFLIENSLFYDVCLCREQQKGAGQPDGLNIPTGSRLVVYAGTFEPYQGLGLLLRGFATVRDRLPRTTLLLLGGTVEQVAKLRQLADELGLKEDCIIHERLDAEVARNFVRRADLVVSPRIAGSNTPLKIYEAMANGAVMVATRILSHTQVLNDEVAVLVDPEPWAFGQGILTGICDGQRRAGISLAAKQLYEREYSAVVYEAKMSQLLECVMQESPCAA
jgi:glycosyltransferase involved in cell wall biosynthesis